MTSKIFAGLGLVLLIILIIGVIFTNRQQTYDLAAKVIPTATIANSVLPPPTFMLTPILIPTSVFTAVATQTTAAQIEPSTATPTSTVTAVATQPPTTPTPSSSAEATHSPIPTPSPIQVSPEKSMTFAVIGDYGFTGQGTFDVATMVREWQPDIVLTVGDNNYPNGSAFSIPDNITQHYGTFIEQNRFFPALGNHDVYTDLGQPYFDYFDLPGNERYYDFVWGDAHFFAVNSDWQEPDGITSTSRQAQWLQAQLAASESAWQIVYFHAPPFVSNKDKIVPAMNWPFAAWGADIVFSGHAHVYERLTIDGIPYIVNGVGGHSIYNFDDTPHPASDVQYNVDFGAVLVEITASELTLRFIDRTDSVIDFYTVVRP